MRIVKEEEEEGGEIKDGQLRMEKGTAEYRNGKRTEVRKRGLRAVRTKCGKWEIRIQKRLLIKNTERKVGNKGKMEDRKS